MTGRLSFGLPPIRTASAKLAVAVIVFSLAFAISLKSLALNPGEIIERFYLWQIFTHGFVEMTPMGVIFGALVLWSVGGSLEQTWGASKLVTFLLTISVLAGIATVPVGYFFDRVYIMRYGGGLSTIAWIAFGLSWGNRQTGFWGMPVTGNVLALIGVGFIVLGAAFNGPFTVVPDAFAAAFTFAAVKLNFPGGTLERFNSWRLRRQLDKRRQHLNVVSGDRRNMPNDSDRFIH